MVGVIVRGRNYGIRGRGLGFLLNFLPARRPPAASKMHLYGWGERNKFQEAKVRRKTRRRNEVAALLR